MGFWSKVYLYSKGKVHEEHLNKWGCDLKCPGCSHWFSVSAVEYKHTHEAIWFGSVCTCGQCKHKSYWNMMAAPVPLLCDENGNPLND